MATLAACSIDLNKIDKSRIRETTGGGRFYDINVIIEDAPSEYGTNVGVRTAQTKEERTAKAKHVYLGNGRVVWTDGKPSVVVQPLNNGGASAAPQSESGDLPF